MQILEFRISRDAKHKTEIGTKTKKYLVKHGLICILFEPILDFRVTKILVCKLYLRPKLIDILLESIILFTKIFLQFLGLFKHSLTISFHKQYHIILISTILISLAFFHLALTLLYIYQLYVFVLWSIRWQALWVLESLVLLNNFSFIVHLSSSCILHQFVAVNKIRYIINSY